MTLSASELSAQYLNAVIRVPCECTDEVADHHVASESKSPFEIEELQRAF